MEPWYVSVQNLNGSLLLCVGKTESFEDQLRSILAQYHYVHEIEQYEAKGVPLRRYLYVPEQHPVTNKTFYEREDEAHLIKVIILQNVI